MILKCIRTVAVAALALVSVNVSGQDLLARQAPIDRKLKAVDSLALIRQIKAEQAVYPAYSLYPNWQNTRVHAYGNTVQIPDTFRIDLTGFCMPTTHTKITSKCGPRWRRMHNGLDIKVYIGDTIRAAFDGKVRMVKYERRGYGKYVVIRHDNGLETIYGHLSKQLVKENEYVKAGDVIGLGGNTNLKSGKKATDSNASAASEGGAIRYHKIRKGDTLGRISRIYHVSIDRLCKMNGIKRTTTLRIGQVLRCS